MKRHIRALAMNGRIKGKRGVEEGKERKRERYPGKVYRWSIGSFTITPLRHRTL